MQKKNVSKNLINSNKTVLVKYFGNKNAQYVIENYKPSNNVFFNISN